MAVSPQVLCHVCLCCKYNNVSKILMLNKNDIFCLQRWLKLFLKLDCLYFWIIIFFLKTSETVSELFNIFWFCSLVGCCMSSAPLYNNIEWTTTPGFWVLTWLMYISADDAACLSLIGHVYAFCRELFPSSKRFCRYQMVESSKVADCTYTCTQVGWIDRVI